MFSFKSLLKEGLQRRSHLFHSQKESIKVPSGSNAIGDGNELLRPQAAEIREDLQIGNKTRAYLGLQDLGMELSNTIDVMRANDREIRHTNLQLESKKR